MLKKTTMAAAFILTLAGSSIAMAGDQTTTKVGTGAENLPHATTEVGTGSGDTTKKVGTGAEDLQTPGKDLTEGADGKTTGKYESGAASTNASGSGSGSAYSGNKEAGY